MVENNILQPDNQDNNRNSDGTFKKGLSGNLAGRPKGQSLKEYDRERFSKMTPEEKEEFLKSIAPEIRYRMAEGNPQTVVDANVDFKINKLEEIQKATQEILNR